jgi:creatinine amidohydrolase
MSVPIFDMSEHDFRISLKKIERAIIPVGSLEQHGPHLPVSTDTLIAEHVARAVAQNVSAFILPVISYGISFEHEPMFNVSLQNSTLSTMISDVCSSLAKIGLKQVIILNGHHGNMGALQYIPQELHRKMLRHTSVHTIHYWQMMRDDFDHAGEVETSLVLAIEPKLVHMERAVPNSKKLSKTKAAYSSITNVPGSFPRITGNGVWGDPRKATVEKGDSLMTEIISNLTRTLTELG